MKEIESRLIYTSASHTRMRVTWNNRPGWFERLLMPWLSSCRELTAIYERHGEVWRVYGGGLVSTSLGRQLNEIEQRLTRSSDTKG